MLSTYSAIYSIDSNLTQGNSELKQDQSPLAIGLVCNT